MPQPILDEEIATIVAPQNKWIVPKTTHQRLFIGFVVALGALCVVVNGKELLSRSSYVVEIIHSDLFFYLFIGFYGVVSAKYLFDGHKKENHTAWYPLQNLLLSIFFGMGIAIGLIFLLYPLYAGLKYCLLRWIGIPLGQLELGGMMIWLLLYGSSVLVVALGHYGWYNNGFQQKEVALGKEEAGWKPLSKWATLVFVLLWLGLLYSHGASYYATSAVQYKMVEMLLTQDVAIITGGLAFCLSISIFRNNNLYNNIVNGIQQYSSIFNTLLGYWSILLLFCVYSLLASLIVAIVLFTFYAFFGDGKVPYTLLPFGWFIIISIPFTALLAYGAAYTLDYSLEHWIKK